MLKVEKEYVAEFLDVDVQDLPNNINSLITKAIELLNYYTLNRLDSPYLSEHQLEGAKKAVGAQIEYWLEVGEELAIVPPYEEVGLGSLSVTGKLPILAPRARRLLLPTGLLSRGVSSI
jgi:hypothetical protein